MLDAQPCFGDKPPQRRRLPQPARAIDGKSGQIHRPILVSKRKVQSGKFVEKKLRGELHFLFVAFSPDNIALLRGKFVLHCRHAAAKTVFLDGNYTVRPVFRDLSRIHRIALVRDRFGVAI
jgi:hypothetical protein